MSNAIVIGASMAGLLAASSLAQHFDDVLLLEKDVLPGPDTYRKSVPQGRHIHVLLERGRRIIERRLPGFTDEMRGAGACDIADASRDVRWYHSGFHRPGESDVRGIAVTRPRLEACVRRRVLARSNVRLRERCRVLALDATTNGRVAGVRVSESRERDGEETIPADLVVDAGGRGSRSPEWLTAMGYAPPEEESLRINLGYSSCFFRRKPHQLSDLDGMLILTTPERKAFGVVMAQEENRWMVTLGGMVNVLPPTEYPEMLAYARALPARDLYELMRVEEPISEPHPYRFPASLRRHYEKLKRFPEGYIVVGDALCSFNPIYGQGMTVAALEADALDDCLSHGRAQLARRFFAKASKIIDVPWSTAVGNDLAFPEVEGPRPFPTRLINWYLGHLHRTACDDADVSIAFLRVVNMLAPPPTILHPKIVWRVLRHQLGQRQKGPGAAASRPAETP